MIYKNLSKIIVFVLLLLPVVSLAAFKPLVGIPGIDNLDNNFNAYINALYALSISVAALLAVIKIIIAGMKWMLSDIVTRKEEAKSDMNGAIIGLLIVISAVVVLNQINPQLTTSSLFLSPVTAVPRSVGSGSATGGGPLPTPYLSNDLNGIGQTIQTNNSNSISKDTVVEVKTGTEQEWQNMRDVCAVNLPRGIVYKETKDGKQVYVCR